MSKNVQIKLEMDFDDTAAKPKGKRGRKKKNETDQILGSVRAALKQELITDHMQVEKKKRKINRFNGMPEEEVLLKTLPDCLAMDLDILIIGINPGLYAAYIGHHYAGPGNHFWKCLYLSGLVPEPMTCYDDIKAQKFGIGFTNMCARTTRGSADLKKPEIVEGANILIEKIKEYKPKIAVFNGKGIYEVFSGSKKVIFGKQPGLIEGTQTVTYVMPSSSARCAQLPRAVDKVPFYDALRRLRDYVIGRIHHLDESEVTFPTLELKNAKKEEPEDAEDKGGLGVGSDYFSNVGCGRPKGSKNKKKETDEQLRDDQDTMESYQHLQQQMQQHAGAPDSSSEQQQNVLSFSRAGERLQQDTQPSLPSAPTNFDGYSPSGQPQFRALPSSASSRHGISPTLSHTNVLDGPSVTLGPSPYADCQMEFMSKFYSGSQHFGMVGFPNAVAFSFPSSMPPQPPSDSSSHYFINNGQKVVKIKSEPVDEPING